MDYLLKYLCQLCTGKYFSSTIIFPGIFTILFSLYIFQFYLCTVEDASIMEVEVNIIELKVFQFEHSLLKWKPLGQAQVCA